MDQAIPRSTMKSVVAMLLALVGVAEAAMFADRAVCGQQTQVCFAGTADAAGTPQYTCSGATDGEANIIAPAQYKHGVKICGPGSFKFSPMHCHGGRFEYKMQSEDVSVTQATTSYQEVTFKYDMACYSVSC